MTVYTECLSTPSGSTDPHQQGNYQQETTEQKSCVFARWLRNDEKTGEPFIDLKAGAQPALISRMLKVIVFLKKDGETVKAENTVAEVKLLKKTVIDIITVKVIHVLFGKQVLNHFTMQHTEKNTLKRITGRCAYTKTKVRFSRSREKCKHCCSSVITEMHLRTRICLG